MINIIIMWIVVNSIFINFVILKKYNRFSIHKRSKLPNAQNPHFSSFDLKIVSFSLASPGMHICGPYLFTKPQINI